MKKSFLLFTLISSALVLSSAANAQTAPAKQGATAAKPKASNQPPEVQSPRVSGTYSTGNRCNKGRISLCAKDNFDK